MAKLIIDNSPLSLEQFSAFLREEPQVELSQQAVDSINAASAVVQNILKAGKPVYGVNTGFGKFAETRIPDAQVQELQKRLILSHAAGVGRAIPRDVVRLMLLIKIKSLALGHSGIRKEVVQRLVDMLNNNILPVIPSQGSVGASGDLAPLAHMSLPLLGEGRVFIIKKEKKGSREWSETDGKYALEKFGWQPLTLEAKEGLALINGTQAITAFGLWGVLQAHNLVRSADVIGAITHEGLLGSLTPFDERIQAVRNHSGQQTVAANFRKILRNSPIVESHKDSPHRVQDAYSLRCIPQVHGAVRDALDYVEGVFLREANGVTDNPLVFPETGDVLSGGNFHGAPVAHAADFLAIVLTDLASISERRMAHMLDSSMSEMASFLTQEGGLNSGFMIAQVTAASLVSECKVLAHPSSVDSIPTSANKEDHVSMGTYAARKLCEIVRNLEHVLAIELIAGCQALDLRAPVNPAMATGRVQGEVRGVIPFWKEDRFIQKDILAARELIRSGAIVKTAEKECGELG
jgi:histidine ammonia-lyase